MDPPSLETISKYIFKPLRAPPPPPSSKVPTSSTPNATIAINIKEDEIPEDEHGPLSLVSLLRQDKHGGSLRYLPKYIVSTYGKITTTTMIPPHSSVEVGPGTHQIIAELNSLQLNKVHTDFATYHEAPPPTEDVKTTRPTNYDYELMPLVNLQLSKRHPSARKTNKKMHRSIPSDSTRKSKKGTRSKPIKTSPNKATKSRPKSAPKAFTHNSPSPYVGFPPSTNTIPAPIRSLFFDPNTFNNIDTRPGYFEAFPNEELMNWTLRLKVFEESQTMPRLEPVEAVDRPYLGTIACDDPEADITEPPKHVQLRANLRYDNAFHKRWNVDRNDFRGKKASIWPLWNDTEDDKKRRLVQLQKLTLATIWDETIAMDRGTVQFLDDFFVNGDDAEDTKAQKPRVFEDELKAAMKLHLSPGRVREEVEEDADKTIVPDREDRDEEAAQKHYRADSAPTTPPRSDVEHEKESHEKPRLGEGNVRGLCDLGYDVESLLQTTPAFRRLRGFGKGGK